MSTSTSQNANDNDTSSTFVQKTGLAKMLKGGVIMDVVNAEQVGLLLPQSPRCDKLIANMCTS